MGFRDTWHRSLVYFGLAEDPDYDYDGDYEPETETTGTVREPSRPARRSSAVSRIDDRRRAPMGDFFDEEDEPPRRLRSVDGPDGSKVHLVTPRNFNDAQEVADNFKRAIPVILNLQDASNDLSKRLIDFGSGLTYALDGGMSKIADKTFLLTPRNVEVSAEEKARLVEKGFFNQS